MPKPIVYAEFCLRISIAPEVTGRNMWPGHYDLPDPTVAYSFLVKVNGRIRTSRFSPLVVQDAQGNLRYGAPDKPDYAGLLTYAGLPYTQDPAELAGVDVAIVGAPVDDLVSDRPGTRFGPRAPTGAGRSPGSRMIEVGPSTLTIFVTL